MVRIHQQCQANLPTHCPENARQPKIWSVSLSQNAAKMRNINTPWPLPVLKVVRIHQHAKSHTIPPMRSSENTWKPQFWPDPLSENAAKMRKINRLWLKSNQFWSWSGCISMSNFRQFLQCSPENVQEPQSFFYLCDLQIWQMTLKK